MSSFREAVCTYMIESARAQQDMKMLEMLREEMYPKSKVIDTDEIAKEIAQLTLELKTMDAKIANIDKEIDKFLNEKDKLLRLMEEVKMLLSNKK